MALQQREQDVLEAPPVRMRTVPCFDTAVFPYTTDIPLLSNWGEPLLYGPGSVLAAWRRDARCCSSGWWPSPASLSAGRG